MTLSVTIFLGFCLTSSAQIFTEEDPEFYETPEYFFSGALDSTRASTAYSYGYTGAGSTIAFIDSGYYVANPDLAGKFSYYELTALNGLDPAFALFTMTHGTSVAAAAAGVRDGAGMHGVAYDADLIGFTQSTDYGVFTPPTNLTLFTWAKTFRPTVINNSWTSTTITLDAILAQPTYPVDPYQAIVDADPEHDRAYQVAFIDAIDQAQQDSVIVFGTTNDATQTQISYLTGLPLLFPQLAEAWIAVVNADGNTDTLISGACGSAAMFCMAAMGNNVTLATATNAAIFDPDGDGFMTTSGSSFATPQVSGAVAIARQIYPDATPAQLTQIVLQTARDIGDPGIDAKFGWGFLDLANLAESSEGNVADVFAAAGWARFSALRHVGAAVRQRLAFQPTAPGANPIAGTSGHDPSVAVAPGNEFWLEGLHGISDIDSGDYITGYRAGTDGFLIGYDVQATAALRLGAALGISSTTYDAKAGNTTGSSTGRHLAAYADWTSATWFARGVAQMAQFDQTTMRSNIPGTTGTSMKFVGRGETEGSGGSIDVRFGRAWQAVSGMRLAPYLSATHSWQQTDAFTETGAGAFSLTAPAAALAQTQLGVGMSVTSAPFDLGSWRADLALDMSYSRLYGDRSHDTAALMLGNELTGLTETLGSDAVGWGVKLGLGNKAGSLRGELGYSGQYGKTSMDHRLDALLRIAF